MIRLARRPANCFLAKTLPLVAFLSKGISTVFGQTAGDELDYNRDVRPILSDNCFRCHGPDADNQKSDFRLDTRASFRAIS